MVEGDERFPGVWRVKGTYPGDGNIGNSTWKAYGCWRGEEEFIVFATM
jgi:hypothetical protein